MALALLMLLPKFAVVQVAVTGQGTTSDAGEWGAVLTDGHHTNLPLLTLCSSTSSSRDHFHIHPPDSQAACLPQAGENELLGVNCKQNFNCTIPVLLPLASMHNPSDQPVKAATQRIVSSYPSPLSCSMPYNACKSEDKSIGE